MIIDTHCHLDDTRYDEDLGEVVARAKESGVKAMIIAGANIHDLPKAAKIAQDFKGVFFAAGVHPYDIDGFDEGILREFLTHEKCVAVGECGLDYYREVDEAQKARQLEVFRAQIELAKEFDKPLIIHIREANEDAFGVLNSNLTQIRGVLHCFNASPLLLGLSSKFYYGIGGVLTFKNAKKLVEILPQIPQNRLLLETDAPYLTPEPFRGTRNESARTALVAQKMAELLNLELKEVERITTQNAVRLFGEKLEKEIA